jgi:hypothetical protein
VAELEREEAVRSGLRIREAQRPNNGTGTFWSSSANERAIALTLSCGDDHHAIVGVAEKGSFGAGFFDGNVHVTRSITVRGDVILTNKDCAEEFYRR